MFEQFVAIFKNTLVESIRQPIYFVLVGIGIIALVMNLSLSSFTLQDDNKFLIDMGMTTIFLIGLLIAAFVATSVLAEEIKNKTVLTVVSKPVGRPVFIFGKYCGVSAALMLAMTILSVAFLLTVRHKVMQAASDHPDYPVYVFGTLAILISVGIGVWCNYFYGWVFTSTTIGVLTPLAVAAWLATMAFGKEWQFQLFSDNTRSFLSPDFHLDYMLALGALALALLILAAVAIAASTRLGQVMTIFVCILVFMLGLLSDHLFGRHAFESELIARIVDVEPERDLNGDFSEDGDNYAVRLDKAIEVQRIRNEQGLAATDPIPVRLAADPLGLAMLSGRTPDELVISDDEDLTYAEQVQQGSRIVLSDLDGQDALLTNIGDLPMSRPPRPDDYLLAGPPTAHPVPRAIWSVIPDLQFMVLIDPITQRHRIPLSHMGLVAAYAICMIFAILCIAVILFQKREVG